MPGQYPEVPIFRSEVRTLASTITGQTYRLDVWLPPHYDDASRTFPIIYLLDSNMLFGAAVNLALPLTWGPDLPEMLIVGIGYDMLSYDAWAERRIEEMLTHADRFLQFIETELIPFVEANYRADPADRLLTGHSLGGHLVWYALFNRPGLFRRYCASDPGVVDVIVAAEKRFAETGAGLPAKVVLLVARQPGDDVPKEIPFVEGLLARNYGGLDLKLLVMDGENHGTIIPLLMTKGWPAVFAESRS